MSEQFLLIESSGDTCSVALSLGESTVSHTSSEGMKHAEQLAPMAMSVLETATKPLDAVILSQGPGSYTGLRIGAAFAKGFCFAKNIPLITINTLQSLAYSTSYQADFYLSMIDARRMEVYGQIFSQDFEAVTEAEALVLKEDSYEKWNGRKLVVVGSGAEKFSTICKSDFRFDTTSKSLAIHLLKPAIKAFEKKEFADLFSFEPNYLKPFFTTAKTLE